MTAFERYQAIQKLGPQVELPFDVRRFFKDFHVIELHGTDISLGADFGSLEGVREALGWLVNQLGGTVKWSKE